MSLSRIFTSALVAAAAVLPLSAGLTNTADLFASKNSVNSAPPNTDVTFTITIGNAGPNDALTVTLKDPLPAGMTFVSRTQTSGPAFSCTDPGPGVGGTINCTIPTFTNGATATFDFVANTGPAAPGTTFTNQATISATGSFDPNPENDTATSSVTIPTPSSDATVTKSGPDTAGPDVDVVYTITVLNAGPDTAATFTMNDILPGTMTFVSFAKSPVSAFNCTTPAAGSGGTVSCSASNFPAGASESFTLTGHIPPGTADGTIFSNTATVSAPNDPNPENDSGSAATTVTTTDLSITKAGPAAAPAGSAISYTITAMNNGPSPASGVVVSDALPAGLTFTSISQSGQPATCNTPPVGTNGTVTCNIASLQPTGLTTFTLVATSSPSAAAGTVFINSATVSSTSNDPNSANNTSPSTTTLTASADLSVVKTANATVLSGTNVTYTINVANGGPSDAQTVAMNDTLPAGTTFVSETQTGGPAFTCMNPLPGATGTVTCAIPTLAAGASAQFSVVARVAASTPDATVISNTATVSTVTPDPVAMNNSSTATTTASSPTDLALTKTGPATAVSGSVATYTVTVLNGGGSATTAVVMNDPVPTGATFASQSQTSGPAFMCTAPAPGATGTVNCSIGSLAAGASATFSIALNMTAAPGSSVTNTATVSSTTPDPIAANNSGSVTTAVVAAADLAVTKSGPANALPGANVSYTITVLNSGGSSAATVALTDVLPAGTGFVSMAQTAGPAFTCTGPASGATGTVSCTAPSLSAGASATFTLVIQLTTAPLGSTISNTATVSSTSTDSNPANNAATATTTVVATIPTLSLSSLLLLSLLLSIMGWAILKR